MLINMEKNSINRVYITERELIEIYQLQYNDIFPEILKLDHANFLNLLQRQVAINLSLIKKHSPPILLKKIEEMFSNKFLQEKEIVSKDYEMLKSFQKEQLDYLDRLNCVIHCIKCKCPLHTCGFRLVLYGDYVYCLYCMKVYNEYQVNLYCEECDVEYYTKLREIVDYNLESYFLISISDYHCNVEEEQTLKCPQCEADLYADIMSQNNTNKIEEATCLNCNFIFDISLFKYECKKCGQNFKSDAKIYNDFNYRKNDLLCKIHTLNNKKLALPESLLNKACECNLNYVVKYKHHDGGLLYEGEKNGEKVIVCEKCLQILDYIEYNFSCPLCNKKFKQSNIYENYQQTNLGNEKEYYIKIDKINLSNLPTNKKSNISSKKKNKKIIKKDNNIINPFINTTKSLKNNNNQLGKSLKITTKFLKDKEALKNNISSQSIKNSGQKIKIKIQNLYNNYSPIIHIVENNSKNTDRNKESKYNLNRNITVIHSNPKMKKIKPNLGKASKYISNAAVLKRSITETSKYNIGENGSFFNQKKKNSLNSDKEKQFNINCTNNIWPSNIKKYSASFTVISSDSNNSEQTTNNQSTINKSPIKEQNSRYSSENKIKNKMNNKKKRSSKFNINEIAKKNNKESTIKEIKEEYMNEKPEIKAKIQKADLKKDNSDENMSNILDKSINKITKITISSSLSDKKDKKKEEKNVKKEQGSAHNSNKDLVKIKTKSNMIKEKNSVKINNENPSSLRSSNAPKRKKVKNNHSENKKLTNSNDQIIKNFNSEDYNIIGMLGEGTFSQIFLVENGETKEKFALKKLTATKVEDLESKKEEFELILKLRKEEKQLNIVKIYGIQIKKLDKFNMVLYILMEAAKSDWETELKNRHFAKNFYNEEELKNILISLVKTFSSLQKRGICHRDVKPQNILYFEKDGYKITDFGEGKANKNGNLGKNCNFNLSEDTSVQTVRGTELYMSPILFNALRNSPGDDLQYNAFKSDVFSLGLCFLLAGSLSYKPLSELRDLYEMDKIKLLIEKYFKGRYSKNFMKILFSMLQIEEKNRPDFIELENLIKKAYEK